MLKVKQKQISEVRFDNIEVCFVLCYVMLSHSSSEMEKWHCAKVSKNHRKWCISKYDVRPDFLGSTLLSDFHRCAGKCQIAPHFPDFSRWRMPYRISEFLEHENEKKILWSTDRTACNAAHADADETRHLLGCVVLVDLRLGGPALRRLRGGRHLLGCVALV